MNFQPNHFFRFLKYMLSGEWLHTTSITNYQHAPSKSAEAIANNQDLLAEILVRLPVKSLVRFKSVSKDWYSFISDPKLSRRLQPDTVSGLFLCKTFRGKLEYEFVPLTDHKPFDAPFKSLTFDDNPSGLRILQSCNGILLCCSNKQDYYIYNPTTKQHFKLPQLANQDTIKIYGVALAFDPTKSPHYKVVFLRQPTQADFSDHHDKNCYQIEVYSSQTRSWSLCGNHFVIAPNGTDFKAGVFCNGAIHWPFRLYFNVEEEKLGEIAIMPPIPEGWQERTLPIYFGASRDHLQVIEIYGPLTAQFNIYELKSDYSSWFVKYHVDLEAVSTAFPGMMIRNHFDPSGLPSYVFSVLSVVREADDDEESYLVLHIPGMAIHYNLKYGIFRKICDFASNDKYPVHNYPRYYWDDASPFIPTLSPV